MAYRYTQPHQQPSADIHLKPMFTADQASLHSGISDEYYKPVSPHPVHNAELARLQSVDRRREQRINTLQIISRTIALILSGITVAPLVMTLIKFFQTKNTYYSVDGVQRNAWATNTHTWFTFMYAGVSAVSFLFNLAVIFAYCRSVRRADSVSKVYGWWNYFIDAVHIVVWTVSAGIYRYGKEPVDGKFRDLWGWTCSTAADELQAVVTDVKYSKYCAIQTSSFYSGLINVGTGLLSAVITVLIFVRSRSQKKMIKAGYVVDEAREPLRG